MAFNDNFEGLERGLELQGIIELDREELGRGAYGRVYAVKYCKTVCAAKEIHTILVEGVGQVQMHRTIESFMRECRQCSRLRHPNVILFLGVYYPTGAGGANRMRLPVMVMEMMADSLTSFVKKHEKIPVHIKYSIVHDVSLGLCYLHNHDPPIVHRDLSPNNILLTAHHVAKISDLGVAKVIKADSRKTMTKAPGTVDFMPPESLANSPVYGPPMDVFSFAGIILHTFNQQWPRPTDAMQFDPKTRRKIALLEVERRQQYLDKMIGEAKVLRRLVEECLDDDPAVRPTIASVCERIQVNKDVYIKECPQDIITVLQQLERLREESKLKETQLRNRIEELQNKIEELRNVNDKLRNENEEQSTIIGELQAIIDQMSSTRSTPTQQVASQLDSITLGEGSTAKRLMPKTEAPPLLPGLTSGRCQVKWTRLADLPAPLHDVHVAVNGHKIYVTGGHSPVEIAEHQVYVYNINTDQWGQLPPSGHYAGVPHIIGDKLAIIGGHLSATKQRTNKVTTFDDGTQTWTSYYPDLLSVRSMPGVVSHQEYVIVVGGRPRGADTAQDDIEVLNWIENFYWRKASIKLPVPMYEFSPVISDDHLFIVGYAGADGKVKKGAYKLPVASIITSTNGQHNSATSSRWTELTAATHSYTALVPGSSPPLIVGGWNNRDKTLTADIKMYDNSDHSWRSVGSLSSARYFVAVAAVDDNAIVIIGGCSKGGKPERYSSSLTVVELGEAELLYTD